MAEIPITPSMKRAPVLPLIGGNVLKLYDVPLYLYPTAEYTLTVTVEQEPLKLYDTFALTTETQRDQLRIEAGIAPESLLPYIVQMHGLFTLPLAVEDSNHLYEPFYHYAGPNEYDGGPTQPTWWYCRPAFRPEVQVYVNGELKFTVTTLDYPALPVVTFRGSPSATAEPTWNDHPIESVYAYSPSPAEFMPVDGMGREAQRFYLRRELPGDGTWHGEVTLDGHCRMTVRVTSMSRDIEMRFAVEQRAVPVPGHWGTCAATAVEDYQIAADDPGVWFKLATYRNNIAFQGQNMCPDMASLFGKALVTARGNQLQPFVASTMYTGAGPVADNMRLDWTSLGTPTESAELHYLKHTLYEKTDVSMSGSEKERFWETRSPLLVGIDKAGDGSIPGAFRFGITGTYGDIDGVPTTDPPYTNDEAKRLLADAKARRESQLGLIHRRPRVKITLQMDIDEGADGDIDATLTGYAYYDLPYTFFNHTGQTTWEDVVDDPDPTVAVWDDGITVHTIAERTTEDWRQRGEIGFGKCHFIVLGGRGGVFIADAPQLGDTLSPLYPGPDSYQYRYDDPAARNNYATWAANL